MTACTPRHLDDSARPGPGRAPRGGFSLIEVLIATVVLGIGLIGLGAIFPAVIAQQRAANDLTASQRLADNADAYLDVRLGAFDRTFEPIEATTGWIRINAQKVDARDAWYLRMPPRIPRSFIVGDAPPNYDFRLRVEEVEDFRDAPLVNGDQLIWRLRLSNSPIDQSRADNLRVRIRLRSGSGGDLERESIVLQPDDDSGVEFEQIAGPDGRFDPDSYNSIDFDEGALQFNVIIDPGQTVERIDVRYQWLDDRIISHRDRLYPAENPQYGWEMAFRKSPTGVLQHCLFVYRIEGPPGLQFTPDIPANFNAAGDGMLRIGSARVVYDDEIDRAWYLESPNGDLEETLEAGTWLLPTEGDAPIRVRRQRRVDDELRWYLDAPPVRDGDALEGNVDFWYLPREIDVDPTDAQGQPVTWRLTPLLARTS